LTGKQGLIEGEQLSLPEILNASLFTKIRYQKTNGTDADPSMRSKNSGELQFPDEFSLLIGGRVADNIGFFVEGQLADHDEPLIANFKMPFVYDAGAVKLSAIPFTSGDLGASFGFELLNTGAVHNMKASEHGEETSAQQYIGTTTAAEGVAFVLYNPMYHVNLTKWSPNHVAGSPNSAPTSTYVRGAVTPGLQGWDFGFGFQVWSGGSRQSDGTVLTDVRTEAVAIDAQAQGEVSGMPLGVYVTHASAKASDQTGGPLNVFNDNPNKKTATTLTAELGVIPNRLSVLLGFRKGDTGADEHSGDNAITVGANFKIRQNVMFQVMHSKYSGSLYDSDNTNAPPTGTALTTFMLTAGF
jgi:hypothetical protein